MPMPTGCAARQSLCAFVRELPVAPGSFRCRRAARAACHGPGIHLPTYHQPVTFVWMLLGFVLGLACAVPALRVLVRRAEARTRVAQRRARDAERLAELGSMTGGLAHEIKNPLSTIGLNAQLLAEAIHDAGLPDPERDRLLRRLDALSREAERLRNILTDFLQFAGPGCGVERSSAGCEPLAVVSRHVVHRNGGG